MFMYMDLCVYMEMYQWVYVCMYVRVQYTYILTPPLHVLTPNHFPIF